MATPIGASALVQALRDEGLEVVEVAGWRTRNRNSKGPWGPVYGVMIHHTVTKGSARTVEICRDGYSSLPGPLCHGVITKDGRVHLVGHGRANHAGSGDDDVLRAVIDDRLLPADNEANTDGNRHFYGFECENLGDGKDPWPAAQLEAIERAAAALCRYHGWDAESVIGHLEWQPGKVDPRGFTMTSLRSRVRARLAAQPGGSRPAPKPAPKPSSTTTYTVRKGDTLWGIARAHGTTVPRLVDLNDLTDPDGIKAGQKIKVPAKAGGGPAPVPDRDAYPGADKFGDGATNVHITRLGQMLIDRGGTRFYKTGPGPTWGTADREATRAFQRAQGWSGAAADGIPGERTWELLVTGKGKDIPPPEPAEPRFEPFPGREFFHAGRTSPIITAMGRRLVAEGCGKYQRGPGPNWTNADKASYAAWQRKLGYTGDDADGIPGKTSWDKLRVPRVS